MMTFSKFAGRSFAAFLLSTVALAGPANAANLPDIPANQISQDTEQRYNPETRRTEFIAPSFDPFELDDTLAGTAALRSASYGTTMDGRRVSGGAFLDVSLFYTTDSNDPYDMRAVERGVYLSGQPVDSIRYDAQILDCSENTREIVYDDSYYSGARYGYLAGVYRLFPRYRGHRGFGHRNYGRRGYRTTYGYGTSRSGRHHTGSGRRGERADRGGRHADREGSRDGADGRGGRRNGRDSGRDRDRTPTSTASNTQLVTIPNTAARPTRTRRAERGTKERRRQDMRRNTRHNRKNPQQYQSGASQSSNPAPKRPVRNVKAPAVQSRPTRVRTVKVPPPSRAQPVAARAQTQRPAPKAPKANRRAISRSVDKHFGGKQSSRKNPKTSLHFYPMQIGGYQRTDVYVSYRCAREETLTLHIPQDRLDAARFDGFTVLLLDRQDREIPVYIPPNYVEGFRQATGNAQFSYSEPAVNPASGYPQPVPERNSDSPIIYGGTGQ